MSFFYFGLVISINLELEVACKYASSSVYHCYFVFE